MLAMPEVDRVVGNDRKLEPELWREIAAGAPVLVGDIMAVRETAGHLVDGLDGRSRAIVQVQNGCDHRCTFCIIPYGRGPSRSVPLGAIAGQTRRLVESGYREVVLTGVDLTSYGKDLPGQPSLGSMLKRLLRLVPELERLRLSSIDPAEIDADLLDLIGGEPRLMPHLHLSVQAGDALVLKRMKRRHTRDDVLDLCARLRALRPGIAFGADLIAGFPTETEAMFANTLELVEEADLTYLHVFPYSARKGTPAARMPQVAKERRKERAARLRAAGARALARYLAGRVGRTERVLVERGGSGRTEAFAPFRIDGAPPPAGSVVPVRADRLAGAELARSDVVSEPAKPGWFQRLRAGLSRSSAALRNNIAAIITRRKLDQATLDELEEALIGADLGVETAAALVEELGRSRFGKEVSERKCAGRSPIRSRRSWHRSPSRSRSMRSNRPQVILVCGVNGTGKTTTIGKMAAELKAAGHSVKLAAGDTFRAAAIEQLQIWGERTGCEVISRPPGADAAGLAFDALQKARAEGTDVLLIDTAGRLHNKAALMDELAKVVRVLRKQDPQAPHNILLVLDATTGQNARAQVETFASMVPISGLVVTKLDGTARGGVVVALARQFGLPVHALGVGEAVDDLRPFEARAFADALLGLERPAH